MASYLVTIVHDSHQTCVKMYLMDIRTATENGRFSDKKKSYLAKLHEKPYAGGGGHPPPPLIRPRVNPDPILNLV